MSKPRDERQKDPRERTEARASVHHRRLLEVFRNAEDEAPQRPDRERKYAREVDEDDAGERVHLVVAGEDDVERDDQAGAGKHLHADDENDEELPAGEPVLRERNRSEEREHHRDRHRDRPDAQALIGAFGLVAIDGIDDELAHRIINEVIAADPTRSGLPTISRRRTAKARCR